MSHPSIAVAPARRSVAAPSTRVVQLHADGTESFLSQLQRQSTGTKLAIVAGGIAAIAGVALLAHRSVANAAKRRAILRSQLPQPADCSYLQLRVEAGSGHTGNDEAYAAYLSAVKSARAAVPEGQPFFVYVGAANSPDTGMPWCGDCRDGQQREQHAKLCEEDKLLSQRGLCCQRVTGRRSLMHSNLTLTRCSVVCLCCGQPTPWCTPPSRPWPLPCLPAPLVLSSSPRSSIVPRGRAWTSLTR